MYRTLDGVEWYEKQATVRSKLGLHGRPAIEISDIASKYMGRVLLMSRTLKRVREHPKVPRGLKDFLIHNESPIEVTSPMEILLHCIFHNSSIIVRVEKGEGCERIASQLIEILEKTE